MTTVLDRIESRVRGAVVADEERGVFRCHRSMFTDPALFELEMKHIFEGNWLFLAHESQVPEPGDYFTVTMGRQPVLITRDKDGELHALINACAHRGAMLCRRRTGNKKTLTCPFHGWTFSNDGRLLKAKDQKTGAYPGGFNTEGSHNLKRVARFESYRGFLFGSLNPEVMPLAEYLGETTKIIDNIVDQAPEGLEVLRGTSSYTFQGNWKLQAENGADGYHVSTVHWNYASTMERRNYDAGGTKAVDADGWSKSQGGFYSFEHGHMLLWTRLLNPEVRPVHSRFAELKDQFGEARADSIVNQTRNLCLYPNVYLMDQFSTQIRVLRPIAVDRTEVTIYCFAPRGESADKRSLRIRQYEDFFNVSGMGTPDDLEEFRACQNGFLGEDAEWNDLSRGADGQWLAGADDNARAIGLEPLMSGQRPADEGLYVLHHQHWVEEMLRAVERERGCFIPHEPETATAEKEAV